MQGMKPAYLLFLSLLPVGCSQHHHTCCCPCAGFCVSVLLRQ